MFHLFYFWFICVTISMDQTLWSQMMCLLVNNELERMWKELVVARFKLLFRQLLGGPEQKKITTLWVIIGHFQAEI